MTYIKIADTEHGELGHNGWTWVLDNPYPAGTLDHPTDHPAYYEETGVLTVRDGGDIDELVDPRIHFRRFHPAVRGGLSRGGRRREHDIYIPITPEQARLGMANRKAFDAQHMPAGGWRVIVD